MFSKDRTLNRIFWIVITSFMAALALPFILGLIWTVAIPEARLEQFKDVLAQLSSYGQFVGVLSGLFAGLAFIGVVYSNLIQSKQLNKQEEALDVAREELKLAAEQLELAKKELQDNAETQKRTQGVLEAQLGTAQTTALLGALTALAATHSQLA